MATSYQPSDVSQIVADSQHGDPHAAEELLQLLYSELRRLAAQKLAHETPGQTLDPTALVHEAYLRLMPPDTSADEQPHWNGRRHFFAAAAEAMRRILVENARRKARLKHGGDWRRIEIADLPDGDEENRVLALDNALAELANEDPQAAKVVELHQFAGLSHDHVADALGISVYQARQKWTYARAWLRDSMQR